MSVCTISCILPAKLSCFGDPTQNPQVICHQRNLIMQIRQYTSKHGEPPPDIYREEVAPAWFGEVLILKLFYFCAREPRELARGVLLARDFSASVGDGIARTRAPGPRAAQRSLCTSEKLVSPDVLTVLSRHHTAFPAVSCTHYRTSFWRYSPGTALLFQQYPVPTSNFAAQAPTKLSFGREAEP